MDWRAGEAPPGGAQVVDAPFPNVHLRTVLNMKSMGHFLRDNLMPLVDVPLRFGLDPRDFVWVMCPSSAFGQYSEPLRDLPLLDHYSSWLPSRRERPSNVWWTDMMAQYLGGCFSCSVPLLLEHKASFLTQKQITQNHRVWACLLEDHGVCTCLHHAEYDRLEKRLCDCRYCQGWATPICQIPAASGGPGQHGS